jgi:hypothetical protein
MTEWYTHFGPSQFGEVPKVQADLLRATPEKTGAKNKAVGGAPGRPNLTLVKMPDKEQTSRRERA